jgi:hypothetical protein
VIRKAFSQREKVSAYSQTDEGLHRGDWSIALKTRSEARQTDSNSVLQPLRNHPSSVDEYIATFSRREKA